MYIEFGGPTGQIRPKTLDMGFQLPPKKFIIVVSFCFSVKNFLFKNIKIFQFSFQSDTNNRKFLYFKVT